jgi:UDP-glucose 4-epimerase
MKILITGGAGFIASHVSDAYVAAGHDVVIIDNLITGYEQNINPKAKFIEMDIRDDEIGNVFAAEKFDVVNHHAAQMDVRKSVEDPVFDASVNILGTLNLLENCKKHNVKKFIFASTGGAIYGEQDYFPADEEHPTRPLSPYGISKLTIEKHLFYYHTVFHLPYVILRYANVYGPRQNPHGEAGVVAIFTTKMLNNEQPVINGDGKQTRDYVFVGDVVKANVKALGLNSTDCINIGTGIETDVNELFNFLSKFTGKNIKEIHGPTKEGEQLRSVLQNKKAQKVFDWSPSVSLEDGLRQTVEFFKSRHKK